MYFKGDVPIGHIEAKDEVCHPAGRQGFLSKF